MGEMVDTSQGVTCHSENLPLLLDTLQTWRNDRGSEREPYWSQVVTQAGHVP